MIKKQEAAFNRLYRKYLFNGGKNVYIKPIVIQKQPWVENGMIKCGDPKCKMMHNAEEQKQQKQLSAKDKKKLVDASKKKR